MKSFSPQFARFLVVGVINTVLGYGLYLVAVQLMDYRWAYTLSYVVGITISFLLNTLFVFRERLSFRKFLQFPAVYVVQYVAGLAMVWLLVSRMGLAEALAPLVVIPATIPITYILSRTIIKPGIRT